MHDARAYYNVFGKPGTPKTLTGSFVIDTAVYSGVSLFDAFRVITLETVFTAGSNGEYLQVQVETSEDGTNWQIWAENDLANNAVSPITSYDVNAAPFTFPKDVAATVATTTYRRSYTFALSAKFVRFSCKSTVGANFGTASVTVQYTER